MTTDLMLQQHQAKIRGLVNRRGVMQLRKLYDETRQDLERRLAVLRRKGEGQSFTAFHLRQVLLQTNDALKTFGSKMQDQLKGNSKLVGTLGQTQLLKEVKHLEKKYRGHTPVLQTEQAAVLAGVYSRQHPALLHRYAKSKAYYTVPVIKAVRMEMAKSILRGDTVDQAVDRVAATDGVFDNQRWRAERIVRTEMAYSYGVVKQATMVELVKRDISDMKKRLVATFDDRTGEDSKKLNGQTVPVSEPFVWEVENSKGVKTGKVIRYMQPPNRPGDREIVIPWRDGWA